MLAVGELTVHHCFLDGWLWSPSCHRSLWSLSSAAVNTTGLLRAGYTKETSQCQQKSNVLSLEVGWALQLKDITGEQSLV